jgi:hypothetical protein
MKRKDKGILYELKLLTRKLQLAALRYEHALQDGRHLDAERILKKSARLDERVRAIKEQLGIADKIEKEKP